MHKALLVSHPMQKTIGQKGKKRPAFSLEAEEVKEQMEQRNQRQLGDLKPMTSKITQRVNTFNIPFTKEITKLDARFNSRLPTRNL